MPATVLRLLSAAAPESTDAELLGQFLAQRDDAAFTELVRRHGPIVWRVCRRLVGSTSADDAFQATFLILACRAESVHKAASVGSWLIGVAGRVARQMRKHDRRFVSELPDREARTASPDLDLAAILDDELTQLPEHLRDPVVLCFLQGQTQQQAAAELGGSVRTIRRRLDRAKALLRLRLERRGIVPVVVAGLIAGAEAPVMGVPPAVVQRAVQGTFKFLSGGVSTPASILAKGIVMESAKLKLGGLLSVATVVVLGLGWGLAGQTPPVNQPTAPPTPPVAGGPAPPLPSATSGIDVIRASAAAYRSANFLVYAPTPTQARVIATEAELHRLSVAKRWLGKELPKSNTQCVIHFTPAAVSTGSTEFTFGTTPPPVDNPKATFPYLDSARMNLTGPFVRMLEIELPHEVTHTVLAGHFGKPLPRWADEGIAIHSEPASELASHDVGVRKVLAEGKAFRLKHLFKMTDYPQDASVLYFQGYSVVQFLLTRKPLDGTEFKPGFTDMGVAPGIGIQVSKPRATHPALLEFVRLGSEGNTAKSWDQAAKSIYGFDSVDDLETAWIEWLMRPKDKPTAPAALPTAPKEEKPELIPPTKLPGQ